MTGGGNSGRQMDRRFGHGTSHHRSGRTVRLGAANRRGSHRRAPGHGGGQHRRGSILADRADRGRGWQQAANREVQRGASRSGGVAVRK